MRYLVDIDWVNDAYIGTPTSMRMLDRLSDYGIGVSIISYGEIFEGAFGAPDPQARLARFRTLLDQFITIPLSDPIMEIFARTRAQLRRTGQLIPVSCSVVLLPPSSPTSSLGTSPWKPPGATTVCQ